MYAFGTHYLSMSTLRLSFMYVLDTHLRMYTEYNLFNDSRMINDIVCFEPKYVLDTHLCMYTKSSFCPDSYD